MVVAGGVDGETIAHELGHAVGGLKDEYGGNGAFPRRCLSERNCSSDGQAPPWATSPGVSLPTTSTRGGVVGAFAGCDMYDSGLFRPMFSCRMNRKPDEPFCDVCRWYLSAAINYE